MTFQVLVIATVSGAVAWLLVAERAGHRAQAAVAKVIGSAGFVLLAAFRADVSSAFDRWVVLALALCVIGDVLLMAPRLLAAGLVSFLLGHLAYIIAFSTVLTPHAWPPLVAAALALAGGAAAVWLWPHLGRLRAAVLVYIVVITAMTWGAFAVAGRAGWTVCAAGALFYLSDLGVARDRFVVRRFASRTWGLPAYYLAQVLFALALGR